MEHVVLNSGWVCCTTSADLTNTVAKTLFRREHNLLPKFDRFVLETTGAADPYPLISCFGSRGNLSHLCHLEAVIATIDAHSTLRATPPTPQGRPRHRHIYNPNRLRRRTRHRSRAARTGCQRCPRSQVPRRAHVSRRAGARAPFTRGRHSGNSVAVSLHSTQHSASDRTSRARPVTRLSIHHMPPLVGAHEIGARAGSCIARHRSSRLILPSFSSRPPPRARATSERCSSCARCSAHRCPCRSARQT